MDQSVALLLGELNGKLDLVIQNQGIQHSENRVVVERVTALEKKQSWFTGIAAGVSLVVSAMWAIFSQLKV